MITKRMLGSAFALLGGLGIIALFAIDFLQAGEYAGIGPAQRFALIGCGLLLLVGLSLIPLGNKPA